MIPSPEVKKLAFRDYRDIVAKRWWIVLAALFCSFLYTKIAFAPAPDVYQAGVRFSIVGKTQGPSPLLFLKSQALAQTVSKKLARPIPADKLLSSNVTAVDGPSKDGIVTFGVALPDPKQAALIANLWIEQWAGDIQVKQRASLDAEAKAVAEDVRRLEGPTKEAVKALVESEMTLSSFEGTRQVEVDRERKLELLAERIKTMEKGREDLSARYTEDHPRMVYMKSEIEAAKADMAALKKQITGFSKENTEKYLLLKKQTDLQRRNYDAMAQKLQLLQDRLSQIKIAQKASSEDTNSIGPLQIIERAQVPTKPVPKPPSRAGQYIFIGLIIGVAICFGLEYLDTTLKIPEEVEFYAGMPFLGYVPIIHGIAHRKGAFDIFSHLRPDSQVAEAFRNVKVSLLFASDEQKPLKTILVTSSEPKEGKTLVASNLAIIFALGGEKTLLIDGDIRKGDLAMSYSLEKGKGFSDLIKGVLSVEEAVKQTLVPGLSFLSPGSHVHNALDLWTSPGFHKAMAALKEKFDRIVIDGTSLLGPSDVLLMSKDFDGMLFVILTGKTKLERIKEAQKKLVHSSAPVVGAVLNRAAIKKDKNYYGVYFQNITAEKGKKTPLLKNLFTRLGSLKPPPSQKKNPPQIIPPRTSGAGPAK